MKTLLVIVALMVGACSKGPDCAKLRSEAARSVPAASVGSPAERTADAVLAGLAMEATARRESARLLVEQFCR